MSFRLLSLLLGRHPHGETWTRSRLRAEAIAERTVPTELLSWFDQDVPLKLEWQHPDPSKFVLTFRVYMPAAAATIDATTVDAAPPDKPVDQALIGKATRRATWEAIMPLSFTAAGIAGVFAAPLGFPVMLGVMGSVLCSAVLAGGRLCRE